MLKTAFLTAMLTSPTHLAIAQDAGREVLSELGIEGAVEGRVKTLESTRDKMAQKGLSFEEVTDFVGVRIHVDSEVAAYEVLGALRERFDVLPGKDKDYIRQPKANGYQSLHAAVALPDGGVAEFQVRTHAMHALAENGGAAHWRYKLSGRA